MRRVIQYEWAEDQGEAVHINAAEKGISYKCLGCDAPMIARQGNIRTHHFAHAARTGHACSPETVLHINSKHQLAAVLRSAVGNSFVVNVRCDHNYLHRVDLLEGVTEVAVEHQIERFRPDITLLGTLGDPSSILELVVAHAPEPETLAYFAQKGVCVFTLWVDREWTSEIIRQGEIRTMPSVAMRDSVGEVWGFRCDCATKGYYYEAYVYEFMMPCWKCKRHTPVVCVDCPDGNVFASIAPEPMLLDLQKKYPFLQRVWSQTMRKKVVGNICIHCRAYQGNFFVSEALIDEQINGLQSSWSTGVWDTPP